MKNEMWNPSFEEKAYGFPMFFFPYSENVCVAS